MDRVILALVSALFPMLAAPPAAQAQRLPSRDAWLSDVRAAMRGSDAFLESRADRGGDRLAIVLDIDNTSLETHYGWPRPVRRTLRFATHAHRLGYAVLFVTGRQQSTLADVRPVLRRAGYRVDAMCGRRPGERLAHSKQRCRRALTRRGWTITANVGNSPTDFVGRDYERAFRLPNYGGGLT